MWKTKLNFAIRELRFVMKQAPEHHGAWYFVKSKLPELVKLNQNTFFSMTQLNEQYETQSACHVIYGDCENTQDEIPTAGLSAHEFTEILKSKIDYGLTLKRIEIVNDDDRAIPIDIVEAHKSVKYMDDGF